MYSDRNCSFTLPKAAPRAVVFGSFRANDYVFLVTLTDSWMTKHTGKSRWVLGLFQAAVWGCLLDRFGLIGIPRDRINKKIHKFTVHKVDYLAEPETCIVLNKRQVKANKKQQEVNIKLNPGRTKRDQPHPTAKEMAK